MKTNRKYRLFHDNKKLSCTSQTTQITQQDFRFDGIQKRHRNACSLELKQNTSCLDVIECIGGVVSSTDVLVVNSGNNEEEILLKTNALATGLKMDEDGIFYTREVQIKRDQNYDLQDEGEKSFSLLTYRPRIKIPQYSCPEDLPHKTYLLDHEREDMMTYVSSLFQIAYKLEVKILVLENIGCSNGYLHPMEDVLGFLKQNVEKYKFCFEKIIFCFQDNELQNFKQYINLYNSS